jgi:hypothetical protein
MQGTTPPAGRQVRPGAAALHGSPDGRLSRDPRSAAGVDVPLGDRGSRPAGGFRPKALRPAPREGHRDARPSSAGRPAVGAEDAHASCRRTAGQVHASCRPAAGPPAPNVELAAGAPRSAAGSPEPDAATTARCAAPPAGRRVVPRAHPGAAAATRGARAAGARRARAARDAGAPRAHRAEALAGRRVASLVRAREAGDARAARREAHPPRADAPRDRRRRSADAAREPVPEVGRRAGVPAPPPTRTGSGPRPAAVPRDREALASRPPAGSGNVRAAVGRGCSPERGWPASAARGARRGWDSGAGLRRVPLGSAYRPRARSRPAGRRPWRCGPSCCGRRSPGSH